MICGLGLGVRNVETQDSSRRVKTQLSMIVSSSAKDGATGRANVARAAQTATVVVNLCDIGFLLAFRGRTGGGPCQKGALPAAAHVVARKDARDAPRKTVPA